MPKRDLRSMTPTPEPPEDHSVEANDMVDEAFERLRQTIMKQNQKHGRHRLHHPDEARIVRKPYADD